MTGTTTGRRSALLALAILCALPAVAHTTSPPSSLGKITELAIAPSTFRVGPKATAGITRARATVPTGAIVSFKLDVIGRMIARVKLRESGRVNGRGVCVPGRKHGGRCHIFVQLHGTVHLKGAAGANALPFSGRILGKKLRPGSYLLVLTPNLGTQTGKPQSAPFTIVP
jgi:hypothetical protein